MKIREHVQVIAQPTVVRLDQLRDADSAWISRSYYVTEETEKHLQSMRVLLSKETGCGIFLIGHYGSGKSHFLAYVSQQLQAGSFVEASPGVLPLSLLNYKASQSLESILDLALGVTRAYPDRRAAWNDIGKRYPGGLFLILDELSEFLRSKPSPAAFNEDLRFLQFLGEWAQHHPLWVLAALQEQIEHTGEMEYDLYRKIKDRYPMRFLLTPAHIKDLIARRILQKKPSYRAAVESLAKEWMELYPDTPLDYADFCQLYPIHPVTLSLLEEIRDRFSQTRGVVDFALNQLLGNEARGISPFLDQPWGHLLTPDRIVDHFADLFEVQPEFLAIAQKVLPFYRKNMASLFERKLQRELAWRLLKLLIVVHLSPLRKRLAVEEAAGWLLLKVSSIDPDRNREVVRRILDTLVEKGAHIGQKEGQYYLELEDDDRRSLDQLLSKTIEELKTRGEAVFEALIPCLQKADFNPFSLPRDRWHARRLLWHFHERDIQIFFGGGAPPEPPGIALQIGIPWGPPAEGRRCYRILPSPLELSADILELAALHQLQDRPLPARVLARVRERITARTPWFCSLLRSAYAAATVTDSTGARAAPPLQHPRGGLPAWLNAYGEWLLRQTFPRFEEFAPAHSPLPREAYREFMQWASEHDLGTGEAPDSVKLIREAYLVPMGLMQRSGSDYAMSQKLDRHELVQLLVPILEHHPTPARVYQHMSAPVYGLVPDQIHLLLLTLLIQGEIDILKGQHSYRDTYETLGNPQQYDKIVPGRALNVNQLKDLQTLCEGLRIPTPRQWSVLAQKRAVSQLRRMGQRQRDQLGDFLGKLRIHGEAKDLCTRVDKLLTQWLSLEKGEHELQGFQHFAFLIGSPQRFLAEVNEIATLPDRFEKLLHETQRLRHLLGYPCITQCPEPDVAAAREALPPAPPPAQPETLENWLQQAQAFYRVYENWYRKQHERWREALDRQPLWLHRVPGIARSKHLAAGNLISQLEALQARARRERCTGLGSLEFQSLCRCGFDGVESPLSETARAHQEAAQRLETELRLFFQQDRVKERVREWVDQKLEMNTRTLSYLEGKAEYPEVENLALFDQHLSGLELVRPVRAEDVLDLLGEKSWEKAELMQELERFFARLGPRIKLRRQDPAPRRELLAWCCEQALKQGCPLPAGFSPGEQRLLARDIQAQWVSEQSLRRLEDMGLGEEGIRRILEMLLDGLIRLPRSLPAAGPVAAAAELLVPSRPASLEELAQQAACLYGQNERFLQLRRPAWLLRLNTLAESEPAALPAELPELLRPRSASQWIVIDCLGLALLNTVKETLPDCLPHWRVESLEYGLVSQQSSTQAFYRDLIEGELEKSFRKINAVDTLIHTRDLDFAGLSRLARAELEIAFKQALVGLDATRPLLVFGDHGFRLAAEGSGFSHGGSSFLERITPVFALSPFSKAPR